MLEANGKAKAVTDQVTVTDKRLAATILGIIESPIPAALLDAIEALIARHRIAAQEQAVRAVQQAACDEIQREVDLWRGAYADPCCHDTAYELKALISNLDPAQIMKGLSDD